MRVLVVASALCAAIAAAPACAQAIHKCVARGKPVSFQSQPCDAGATTVFVRDYTPEPEPPAVPEPARRSPAVRATSPRAARSARRRAEAVHDTCAGTKAQRDAWERRVGLKRTYDQLRDWNDRVARACH